MPGFVSHYIFGQQTYKHLKPSDLKQTIQRHHSVYALGLQGPDIFFYNITFFLRHMENPGGIIHEDKTQEFFANLLDSPWIFLTRKEKDIAKTYVYGFIGHYLLDSTCHPYVYAKTHYNRRKNEKSYYGKHILLESDIDNAILWKFYKKHPSEFHQNETIAITKEAFQIVSSVLYYTISKTFPDMNLSKKEISFSLYCIQKGTRLFYDEKGYKKYILRKIESIVPGYPSVSPMIHNDTLRFYTDPCNERHCLWHNPWDRTISSSDSFYDLFVDAQKEYSHLLNAVSDFFSTRHTHGEKKIARDLLLQRLGDHSYHSGL